MTETEILSLFYTICDISTVVLYICELSDNVKTITGDPSHSQGMQLNTFEKQILDYSIQYFTRINHICHSRKAQPWDAVVEFTVYPSDPHKFLVILLINHAS